MGKDLGKTFRMEELDGGKWRRVVNKIFIGISCQLYISFFGVFPGFFGRIVLILIWFERSPFPLQKLADTIILDR